MDTVTHNNQLDYDSMMQAWKEVFEGLYYVDIKTMYSYSQYDLEVVGIPFTGDYSIDEASAKSYQRRAITVAQMVEYYEQRIHFFFAKQSSIPVIFNHISTYISLMTELFKRNYITSGRMKRQNQFTEILSDLERFANYANSLKGAVSFVVSTENKEKEEALVQSTSLLAKLRKDIYGGGTDTLESYDYVPDQVKVDYPIQGKLPPSRQSLRPWARRSTSGE